MDTSETYIKMCEKAEEIQPHLDDKDGVGGTWVSGYILYHIAPMNQPHDKDGFYHITDEIAIRECEKCGTRTEYIKSSKAVWLPRQDQLQEMVKESLDSMCIKFHNLHANDYYDETSGFGCFTSMEQLWLAFVMKERWNKVWNGENWVASKVKAIK